MRMGKAFGFYWTATRAGLLFVILISTAWADFKVSEVGDLTNFRGTVYCPDGLAQNPAVKGRSHRWPSELFDKVKNETDQNTQMTKIKAEYCNGSTPRAKIAEKIRLVVPKSPTGLALDTASEITKNYLRLARARIKNIFYELSNFQPEYSTVNPGCKNSHELTYWTLLPLAGSEDLETRYKKDSFDAHQVEAIKNADEDQPKGHPTMLVATSVGSDSVIYMLPNSVASFQVKTKIDEMTGQVFRTFDEDSMETFQVRHADGFFVVPQTIGIKKKLETGKTVVKYPILRRAQHMESFLLRNYFVLLMSKDAQNEAFFKSATPGLDFGGSKTPRYFGLDDQGEVKPSKLLEDREAEWRAYFSRFTTVKEAPSSDPNVIDFEVELNTALFCQYGKPVTQFLSR